MYDAAMSTRGIFFVLAITMAAACGGDDGGGGSGVDRGKTVVSLSADERTSVCEFVFNTVGSSTLTCSDITYDGPDSVAECEAGFSALSANCPMTVAQAEGCAQAIASGDCAGAESNCTAVFACIGGT